ncbi:hypothetical protein [Pontibacter qinzhouensis]|nr:hypothetical protein [Pontibacter qinzhouensis]
MGAKSKAMKVKSWWLLAIVASLLLHIVTPSIARPEINLPSHQTSVKKAEHVPQIMVVQRKNQSETLKDFQPEKLFKAKMLAYLLKQLFSLLCSYSAPLKSSTVPYLFSPSDSIFLKGP